MPGRPAPSFGDVTAEYRALVEGAARVEGAHDLLWVEGPDAVSFLQGLVSQEVPAARPGEVRRSLLLAPDGKLEALLWLLRGEDRVGLAVDGGHGARVAERLSFYRIRVKAEIRPEERPVWEVWGPEAPGLAGLPASEARWVERDGAMLATLPLPGTRRVLVAGDVDLGELPAAGELARTAVRVEAGEPVMGRDVDEATIPHETGLVGEAVDFAKGCFLGYELVERMESRGASSPRSLRGLAVTRNLLPPEGSAVWAGDREAGRITSVAESLRVGAPVGLALLHRRVQPGDTVEVRWEGGSVPALVRELPMAGEVSEGPHRLQG